MFDDNRIVAHVLDDQGNIYDGVFNLDSGVTYANEGYRVVALKRIGRYSKRQAQDIFDRELALYKDCFAQ